MNASHRVFKALSDPVRRGILELLRKGEMSAGELAGHFELAKPSLSRHFAILHAAELVHSERRGNSIVYRLNLSVLEEALLGLLGRLKKR
jgi:ArsR family transcriptional regulator, arsenate/arsenite/antimonite-responsive transcriptional repressor